MMTERLSSTGMCCRKCQQSQPMRMACFRSMTWFKAGGKKPDLSREIQAMELMFCFYWF
jgi:hypothetical protein